MKYNYKTEIGYIKDKEIVPVKEVCSNKFKNEPDYII